MFRKIISSRFGVNSLYAILNQILALVFGLGMSILLGRYLGGTLLGKYYFYTSLVGVIGVITNFGIQTILNREIAKSPKKAPLYFGNALGVRWGVSFPLLLITTMVISLGMNLDGTNLIIFILAAVTNALLSLILLFSGAFNSLHRTILMTELQVVYKINLLWVSFLILWFKWGLIEVMVGSLIVTILGVIHGYLRLKKMVPGMHLRWDTRFIKPFIWLSIPITFSAVAEFVNLKFDSVMLGFLRSDHEVGMYAVAYNLFLGATMIPLAVTKIFFPNFIYKFHKNKQMGTDFLKKCRAYFTGYAMVVGLILYFGAPVIISVLYGPEFLPALTALKILSIGLIFIILNRLYNYTLVGLKMNRYYFYASLLGALINIALNMYMIPKFGINGAAFSTCASETAVLLFSGYFVHQKMRKNAE